MTEWSDSKLSRENDGPPPDVWDFGVLLDKEGNVIEPGACEGYHTDE